MRVRLHGGVGEKGRTCVGIEQGGHRILLDVGVNTSVARGPAYYPDIDGATLAATAAIIVTHAHEDHVAALGWCLSHGFAGRILMTAETRGEFDATLADYATPDERRRAGEAQIEIIRPGEKIPLDPFLLETGRSGHVVGGIWIHASAAGRSVGYCGDVVPESPVFAMDPPPACDLVLLDGSYGNDPVAGAERVAAVKRWIAAHPQGAVLPTPLSGRSLELLAMMDGPVAIHRSMGEPLMRQISARQWLVAGMDQILAHRVQAAQLWDESMPLPATPLLCHDGMGMAGPSRAALERAARAYHPVLLTGHLPGGSLAAALRADDKADWLRLPTHPNAAENAALAAASRARLVLAHSCDGEGLAALARAIPSLSTTPRTGDVIDVAPGPG